MVEENLSQEFRLKNIEETRNSFIKEIDQNELMKRQRKNTKIQRNRRFTIYLPKLTRYSLLST